MIVWNNGILIAILRIADMCIIMTPDTITMIEMGIGTEMIDTNRDGLNIVEMSVIAMIITGTDDIDTKVFSVSS
jgi:hypothetical protein